MKKIFFITIILFSVLILSKGQSVVTNWSFSTGTQNSAINPYPQQGSALNANLQLSSFGGTSSLIYKYGVTGNPDMAAQATQWNSGQDTKGWIIEFSSTNFTNLTLSSKQQSGGTNAGPRDFKAQYRIGAGGIWTDIAGATSITVLNDWTTGSLSNISLPSECENQSSVFIRWIMTSNTNNIGGVIASNGISKIDDIFIYGTQTAPNEILGTFTLTNNNFNLTTATVFTNLTINSGITISFQAAVSISGILTCNSTLNTNNNLTLLSDINNTALISGTGTGSINGNITIQRYIPGNGSYNYISSPISNADKSFLGNPGKIYQYSNPTGWIDISSGSYNLTPGKGYAVKYSNSPTINFTGTINTGNISIATSEGTYSQNLAYPPYTKIDYVNYNLLGNPYPSPVQISSFLSYNIASLKFGALWLWDDDNSGGNSYDQADYASFNAVGFVNGSGNHEGKFIGVDYIPTGQGFFVQTENGVSNIDFTDAMRSNINNVFAKSNKSDSISKFYMNVTNVKGLYNQTLIAFKEDATDGVDKLYDCPKMKGNDKIALYSIIDNEPYSIQTLSPLDSNKQVLIGIDVAEAGDYIFTPESFTNFEESTSILLEDKLLNDFIDLRQIDKYNFNIADAGIIIDRFVIHFNPDLTNLFTLKSDNDNYKVYSYKKNIIVNCIINNDDNATIDIFNLSGQKIKSNIILQSGINFINTNLIPGIYISKIISNNKIYCSKIHIY